MTAPLWRPSVQRADESNLADFIRAAEQRYGGSFPNYESLHHWSVERPEQFWALLWDFLDIRCERRWDQVVVGLDDIRRATWFPGARMNVAENLLRRDDDGLAFVYRAETGARRTLSYRDLKRRVSVFAQALRRSGIGTGDRVGAILPNIIDAFVFMLAANSVGAVWSLCSPEFGVEAVLDRLGQIKPKILIGSDSYVFKGKTFDILDRLREIAAKLPELEQLIVIPVIATEPSLDGLSKAQSLSRFIADLEPARIEFEQLPFDAPAFILFSSGTTGLPKSFVHSGGGVLLQLLKEHVLHYDVKTGDRFFYYTSTGWNMWYWLATALAAEATVVLYDGNPFSPKQDALFDLAEQEGLTHFGIAPKYLDLVRKANLRPTDSHDLSALRTILSTGSPLSPANYHYVYGAIKEDVCLSSISGGTEIMTCFATGNPMGPVWRGELQALALGMKTEVFDDDGHSIKGAKGELVCTQAFPSTPVRLLNDPGDRRYKETYFERYPGVWHHGDFAEITPHGGMVIHGRSDATLKPGGIRIGAAEIYRPIEGIDEIEDCLVVGQEWSGDIRIVLFVTLRDGLTLDDNLHARVKEAIRRHASPRHVPSVIIQVSDLPRTNTGKISELAVQSIIHGRPVKNRASLANPECLSAFQARAELEA